MNIFRFVFVATTILLCFFSAGCKNNQSNDTVSKSELCPVPPLGWNSFDSYKINLDSRNALAIMEVMAEKYLPFGYEYFVIDGGWYNECTLIPGTLYPEKNLGPVLDKYGLYENSPTYFPEGMKFLADKAHSLGLKFGLHLMRGIPRKAVEINLPVKGTAVTARDIADTLDICTWSSLCYGLDMSKQGAQEWYNSIFEKLASWGVDFVKVDDMTPYPDEIIAVEKAILNCGRPMVYSLSPGDLNNPAHIPYYRKANMVRITRDIWDRESDIDKSFISWKKYQGTECDGYWPDLDMIPFGQLNIVIPENKSDKHLPERTSFSHWCRLTRDQMRTFITMRALAASPLMIGGDLLTMDDFSYSLLTNKQMLKCNQNGVMGRLVFDQDSIEIWNANDKNHFRKGWIGVFNRSHSDASRFFSKKDMGLIEFFRTRQTIDIEGEIELYDIWSEKQLVVNDSTLFTIPAQGVIFIEYKSKKYYN